MGATQPFKKIISGGQTGADRAALDFALDHDIPHGGWIPKGRLTEDGPLHHKYHLKETPGNYYKDRTEKNVMEADATLIFCYRELSEGSLLTLLMAQRHKKPVQVVDLHALTPSAAEVRRWLMHHRCSVLNVAGPRMSAAPKIYSDVTTYLDKLFKVK